MAHELAHFRRGDHLLRWLEILVTGLYWWHPLVWLLRRELHEAEEQCCDSWVMQAFPDRAKGYAQALMATVDFLAGDRVPTTAGVSALNPVYSFRRRLEMILQPTSVPRLSRLAKVSLTALSFALLLWAPRLPADSIEERLSRLEAMLARLVSAPAASPITLPVQRVHPNASRSLRRAANPLGRPTADYS